MDPDPVDDGGVVRVLNIVVEESRILASRERCPFLVRVEVAETGLQGNDGRLYAAGVSGLGATVEEALAMSACEANSGSSDNGRADQQGYAPYKIPSELLHVPTTNPIRRRTGPSTDNPAKVAAPVSLQSPSYPTTNPATRTRKESTFARGGYQADEYYPQNPDLSHSEPWEDVRQHDYRELHQELYNEPDYHQVPPQQGPAQRYGLYCLLIIM